MKGKRLSRNRNKNNDVTYTRLTGTGQRGKISTFLLLLSLAIVIYIVWADKRAEATLVTKAELKRLTLLAVSQQELLIDQTRQILFLISKLPQARGQDSSACNQTLTGLLAEEVRFANFGIISSDGKLFCSALPFEQELDLSDRVYFSRAIENEGFAVGDYQIGRLTHKATVNFGYAFKDNSGKILGVSFAALDLVWLQEFAERANLPDSSEFIITDSSGIVIVRYPKYGIGVAAQETRFAIDRLEHIEKGLGIIEVTDNQGEKRFLVAAPLKLPEQEGFLHLIINVPKSSIAKD